MPVIINDCEELTTNQPIIIANFQFGQTVDGVIVETYATNFNIEYAEFMQMMSSRTGEFAFRPSACQASDFLLAKYQYTHTPISSCIKTRFAHEVRPLTMTDLLASADLHNMINGPFIAIVDITIISNVLQFGIRNRATFTVASAPYNPVLNICNSHIYQIVIDPLNDCNCHC